MNPSTHIIRSLCIVLFAALAETRAEPGERELIEHPPKAGQTVAEWTPDSSGKGVEISSRLREDSGLKEFKAVGKFEATPATVFAILDDSESYPSFMPYTSECRVLKRDKNTVLAYQRLEIPMVSDRDYTLRSQNAKWLGADGLIYRIRWTPANDEGPAVKEGVARVSVCEGGWLLEPDGEGGTRATYAIFTDSGGSLPPFLTNSGSRIAIRKVFEAIRKRVKDPKYAAASARNDGAN